MKFKEKRIEKSADDSTLNKHTVRLDENDEQSDKELPIEKQNLKANEKTDEDFDKEELDSIQQRFNKKDLPKQKKKKQPKSKITATGSRMILQERSRKVTGSCRKAPEIAG